MPFSTIAESLPGFAGPKTFAAWPVWRGSARAEVRFQPLPRRQAVQLYHKARRFDRSTKIAGRHGGALGHAALQVLHVLVFDFLDYRTGRLDPAYETIARKANLARSTVGAALKRLRGLGIVNWIRRCAGKMTAGHYTLEQETNAYAVLPPGQWKGFHDDPPAPAPLPGTWGDHPALPDAIGAAVLAGRDGDGLDGLLRRLEDDPGDRLAAALGRLGKRISGTDS